MKCLPALAASLLHDPFYQSITVECSDDAARLRMLENYFEYSLLEAQRTGRCVIAPQEEDGAAAWLLPRSEEVERRECQAKSTFMLRLLGPQGSANYHAMIDYMSPRAVKH